MSLKYNFGGIEGAASAVQGSVGTIQGLLDEGSQVIGRVDSTAGDLAGALSGPAGDGSSVDGNDFIDGNQGNDTAFLGAGDDVFQWDPGDGSDLVEGRYEGTHILYQDVVVPAASEPNPFLKFKFETVFTTKIDWSGSGEHDTNDALTAMEFDPPTPVVGGVIQTYVHVIRVRPADSHHSADTTDQDFALVIYNANDACIGDACNGGDAGILFGDGGDGLHFDGKFLVARDLIRDQGIVVDAGFDLI